MTFLLLEKSGSVSIHHRNLQLLVVEIYKTLHDLSSSFMSELFKPTNTKYNLRNSKSLVSNNIKTTNYGLGNSLLFGAQDLGTNP